MKYSPNISMALRAAYLSMHRLSNLHLIDYGITADQFVCLSILYDNPGITQQELAKLAASDANTIRAMLLLLEKKGLVIRKDHPGDGRAFHVSLTRKGENTYEKSSEALDPVRERMFNFINENEADILYTKLIRMSEELNK
ncbi:MAG: MarR family transcriptional regulator [bacterium]